MKSGKSYKRNLLLAATLISLSATMPMAVAVDYTDYHSSTTTYNDFATADGDNRKYILDGNIDLGNDTYTLWGENLLIEGNNKTIFQSFDEGGDWAFTSQTNPAKSIIIQNLGSFTLVSTDPETHKKVYTVTNSGYVSNRPDGKSYGAFFLANNSTPSIVTLTVDNVVISDLNAQKGTQAGLIALNAGSTIQNSLFKDNTQSGLITLLYGGTIRDTNDINILNTAFVNNTHSYDYYESNDGYTGLIFSPVLRGNDGGGTNKLSIKDSYFEGNKGTKGGGLIYWNTQNGVEVDNSVFINNGTSYDGVSSSQAIGGAIDATNLDIKDSYFEGNYHTNGYTGSISSWFPVQAGGAISSTLYKNTTSSTVSIDNTDFKDNYVETTKLDALGGALYLKDAITTITNGSDFTGNYATSTNGNAYGGAIYQEGGTLTISGSTFGGTGEGQGNSANSTNGYAYGGAIYNKSESGTISADFISNSANGYKSYGGAIYNEGAITSINNSTFANNSVTSENSNVEGGAIYNGSLHTIGNIGADFTNNSASGKGAYGGAIYNDSSTYGTTSIGEITKITNGFKGNSATSTSGNAYGGAIYNSSGFMPDPVFTPSYVSVGALNTDFTQNHVEATGYAYGGAIYNATNPTYKNYNRVSIGNIDGNFSQNYAYSTGDEALGGAIYSSNATLGTIDGTFTGNYAKSDAGKPAQGGALFIKNATIGNITADFEGNYVLTDSMTTNTNATAGGAIIIDNTSNTIGTIKGAFTNNYAKSTVSSSTEDSNGAAGGAIANGSSDLTILSGSSFTGNYVESERNSGNQNSHGGAIYNKGNLSITSTTFTGNYAKGKHNATGDGGAIYNYYQDNTSKIATITGSTFSGNYATDDNNSSNGGAIYQRYGNLILEDTSFTGNKAYEGGAIYGWGANVTAYAKTDDVEFTNNNRTGLAGGNGNGLYIVGGSLNLKADTGHTLTINDRIFTGNGMTINADSNGGTVALNNAIQQSSGSKITLNSGTLALGQNALTSFGTSGYNLNFVANGGTLNIANSNIDDAAFANAVDIQNAMNLGLDVNLNGTTVEADKITADITSGNTSAITISAINFINDSYTGSEEEHNLTIADGTIKSLINETVNPTVTGNTNTYTYSYDQDTGILTLTIATYDNIHEAVADSTKATRTYKIKSAGGETVEHAIGAIAGATSNLTINGDNKYLDGKPSSDKLGGFIVASGQELTLKNISQMRNFTTAVDNGGTLNVENVTFTGNTTDINNTATLNLSGSNTINTITGTTGNTNITGGTTNISANGTVTQNAVNLKGGSLTLSGATINADIVADGTGESSGSLRIGDGVTLNGTISGTFKNNPVNNPAIYFRNLSNADIDDLSLNYVNFDSNKDGAIRFISNGDLTLTNNQFTNNERSVNSIIGNDASGAVTFLSSGTNSITGSTFTGNKTKADTALGGDAYGGAIYQNGGTLTISGSTFGGSEEGQGNSATATATNKYGYGGAIYQTGGTLSAANTKFINNSATGNLYGYGGAIYLKDGSANYSITGTKTGTGLTATSTTEFISNQATEGGAINIFNTSGTIDGVVFKGNGQSNTDFGSAVLYHGGTQEIDNSVFIANNSNSTSNAVVEMNNTGSLTVDNSEFINNASMYAVHSYRADMTIKNSEFSGNGLNSNEQSSVISASPYNNTTNIYDTNIKNNYGNAIGFSDASSGTTNTLNIIANEVGGGVEISGNSGYGILVQDRFSGTTDSSILLYAKNGDILIENNAKGAIGSLYDSLGINTPLPTLTLNADTDHNITINDSITYKRKGLNINADGNGGTVALNGNLTLGDTISVGGGTLELGSDAVTSLNKAIETNNGVVELTGGTLTQNIAGNTTVSGTVIDNNATLGDVTILEGANFTDNGGAFTTADNAGTFTINGVTLTADGTSIKNTNVLNLTGSNTIKTITDAATPTGTTNITGGATWIKGGSVTQNTINLKGGDLVLDLSTSLPLTPGTITANIVGDGTVEKTGIILNSGTINGTISGTFKGNNNTALANYGTVGNITADFVNNTATVLSSNAKGGAIYNEGGTLGTISGNFTGNSATSSSGNAYGGAIYQNGGTLTISGSTFGGSETGQGNSATSSASGDRNAYGGAIYQSGGTLSISDSKFINNLVSSNNRSIGGAIYLENGSANYSISGTKTGTGASATSTTEFVGNHARDWGGAIYVKNTSGTIDGVVFKNNSAANYAMGWGGTITYNSDTDTDTNSIIQNSSFISNSGTKVVSNMVNSNSLLINNSEFINNTAKHIIDQEEGGNLTIKDTIIKNNTGSTGVLAYEGWGVLPVAVEIIAETETGVEISGNKEGIVTYGGTTDTSLNLYAKGGDILISGNTTSGIDNTGLTLTLNADTGHNITINDTVSSTTGMTVNAGGTHAGTVALNGALTLGGDTNIQGGTLKLGTGAATSNLNAVTFANTPTLDLQNSSAQTTTVTSISGNANLNIDIDFTGDSVISDAINITTGGQTGVITLDSIAALSSDSDIKEFSNLAILTGETSGVTLAISDALQHDTRFNGAAVETLTWESDYSDNVTFAKSVFTNTEYSETKQKQLSIVDGTKLSFAESTTIPKHATGNITTQDVLQALNQSTNNGRYLNATETNKNYTVGADLGVTGTGRIEVQGVAGSNLNMNSKSGFELSNANTVLYLGQLNISGVKDIEGGLISITGENSYADLSGVTIEDTTNSVILNNGTLNSYGTNNLGTGIIGTGTMLVDLGKTTVGSVVQDSVTIDSAWGELEVQNITTTNGITNNGKLTLTGNANANTISGTGHTTIAGNVNNTRAINQAITVNGSKTLTTAANLIGGTVTNGGKVELTGGALGQTITGGDITIASGEVTSTVANLGGTITNNSNLLLSGTLDKNIAGDSGVTKLNDNMTFADGAGVAGTLNFNGKAITMSGDNKTSTFNIGKINSDGTINIDVNTSGSPVSDVIYITTAGSTGTITINSINEIGARGDDFTLNVLQGTTGSLQLALSDAVHSQFDQAQQHNLYYVSDAYDATIDFDKTSFNTAEWDRVTQKTIGVEDNTKITYATHVISDTATGVVTSKDALAFINQNTDTSAVANRRMVTTDTNKTYTVQEDLGTTGAGTLLVQGASDKTTKLDMNNHSGFVVSNSGTTVTLKDINVDNVQNTEGGLVNITNTGSSATLDGVIVNVKDNPENKANVISSNGTLGVTNSTVNAGVNNNGTMNLNGTNQIASVEGSNGTAKVQTGTTTVGSIFQKLINIVSGGKLASNGNVTATSGITNNTDEGLSVANGTLTGNVTGTGSTKFSGDSAIADGSNVGQAITVVDGKLTTLADGLGGDVTNSGEVDLTGGTLETSITGGNTTISGNVGVDDTLGSIASAVKVETGAKLTTKADNVTGAINNGGDLDLTGGDIKNTISGDGTTTISGTVTNSTDSTIGNAVTVATTGSLTTAADKLGGAVENNGTTNGLTLTGGQLSQNVTGTGKTVIAGTDVSVKYGNSIAQDIEITSGNKLVNTNVSAIGGDVENNGNIQLYSQDNGKLEHDITGTGTTELNRDITVSANIDNTINIKSYTDGTGTHNANVTVESGNNFGKAGQNITVDLNNSLTMQSASDIKGNLVDNGTVELQGGTISNAISGSGAVNITGNTTNNAENTVIGAVSVAENVELAIGTSGNTFNSASSLTMGNGSTLNIQNGSTTNAVMDNLVIATGNNVNVKMDWNDTLNSSSSNIDGSLTVTDINMATSTSSYEATSYAFTNLGNKVALSDPVSLSNVSDTTNNFVSYNNTTGQLTSFRNSLMRAVDKTEAGETATYVMTGDETAGGQTLEGKLLVQGDGHTITPSGVKVHSSTATPAELTLQDVNMNVAGKAIEVTGNNKAIVKASGHDITLTTTDSSEVVSLNKSGTDYAQAEMTGAKTITINGDIKSDDVNNTLTIASGSTVNHAGLLDPITTNVNGTYNRTSGYDETVTYNVNSGGALSFTNDTTLYDAGHHTAAMLNTINFNGGSVNTINGVVTDFNLANMSLTGSTNNFYADVDLANQTMDKFTVANPVTGTGTLNVAGLNLISDAANVNTTINFTTDPVLMAATSYTGGQGLTALSPIYKYNVGYDNTTGNFDFARYNSGGYDGLNPAIMAAPVAAQLGGYLTQLNSYDEAFRNMDMYMLMTASQRQALKNKNKIASLDGGVLYDATLMRQERAEGWFRPFATFEKVPLKNGPKVENIAYGTYMGGESQMYDLGHGWDGIWGAYVGYNGSHQNYDGVSIYQNGGTLGVLGMAYKGNFFTGLTINAGASGVEASTMYGNEDFAMLMAGIASKTGYNWELFNGKFIIQPSMLMSYSFVNTFDYKNAAGVNIDSDPLHAIQLQPEIKFIGNLKNGWQPYASVAMVWNIMDDTKFKANDVSLPELSVKPYVKYGVGVRKTWGERLTGFFQTYLTNGGRNGVGLQAGFTWAFGGGKDKKADEKKIQKSLNKTPELKKTEIVLNGKKVQ